MNIPFWWRVAAVLFCGVQGAEAIEPLHWWLFTPEYTRQLVADKTGRLTAVMEAVEKRDEKVLACMEFSSSRPRLATPDVSAEGLPRKAMTASAWVALDAGTRWGGIVGYMQDNGNYEKGWILGYNDRYFTFAVSTAGTLTYLPGTTPFRKHQWYHVTGVYDGNTMKLYVNGQLESTSDKQNGLIDYPPKSIYSIGAYRDDNELNPMEGRIPEIKVFDAALSDQNILAEFHLKEAITHKQLPFAVSPQVRFTRPGSAEVYWETGQTLSCRLQYGIEAADEMEKTSSARTKHLLHLNDLKRNTVYIYRITSEIDGQKFVSQEMEWDTSFNYTPASIDKANAFPYASEQVRQYVKTAAQVILNRAKIDRGLALVYGSGSGALTFELARQSRLRVVGVDDEQAAVRRARQNLYEAGVYGSRVTIHHVDTLAKLPFTKQCINLIVSERLLMGREFAGSGSEIQRLLRPDGGTIMVGQPAAAPREVIKLDKQLPPWWRQIAERMTTETIEQNGRWYTAVRPVLDGAAWWTHQYGATTNASWSGESLGSATETADLELQWIGRPGADFGIDRNPRMPAPVAADGRLFHQGLNRLIALDAYNGTVLWLAEMPGLRRVNLPRDASNWCVNDDYLFVEVSGQCRQMAAHTGVLVRVFDLPDPAMRNTHDWGYVAVQEDILFGSCVKKGSAYKDFWGGDAWYDQTQGPGTGKVCSDELFAYSFVDGKVLWTYQQGMIINPTIGANRDSIVFVESRHPELRKLPNGRILSESLWQQQFLVSLDTATGEKRWEQALNIQPGTVVIFLACNDDNILLTCSHKGSYYLYCHDANSGESHWRNQHKWPSDNHGGHMQHPVLLPDKVFLEPWGYDLHSGQRLARRMGGREGCSTYAGVAGALIYRGRARRIAMWDFESGKVSTWFNLRPSCWLSVIPAGGMVLAPEGGGGCSCGNWIEASLAFVPRN